MGVCEVWGGGVTERDQVCVRVFVDGELSSEQTLDGDEAVKLMPALALRSVEELVMVEVGFLDELDPEQRFIRIGSDPRGMRNPLPIVEVLEKKRTVN